MNNNVASRNNNVASPLVSALTRTASEARQNRYLAGSALQAEAEAIVRTCRAMAARFHQGGRLLTFGHGMSSADAHHIAVEFAHPVIVGKRTLPAIALANDVATFSGPAHVASGETFAHQLRHLALPQDIVMAISADGDAELDMLRGLETARDWGLLTIALTPSASVLVRKASNVDHVLMVEAADPAIVRELQVMMYHLISELVHIFLEQPDELEIEIGQ
jgi:D-sedoheptulose 7-phosphate isomerase